MNTDDYIKKDLTRRDFLKKVRQLALTVGGVLTLESLLSSCALIVLNEKRPLIYPPLKGHKVQPPQDGCFIGFHAFNESCPDYYRRQIGKEAKILIYDHFTSEIRRDFPIGSIESISSQLAIPFVYKTLNFEVAYHGFKNLVDNKEFKEDLIKYAKDIVNVGKPFFFCTMPELNISSHIWGRHARTAKKVWKYMWQIFEDTGANEYATWVWEVYCPAGRNHDYPNFYYPGDKYVDWIGLSAFSRDSFPSTVISFNALVESTYRAMRGKHPDKPVMMSEFGRTTGSSQARWLRNAFKTIKSWPGMKAAIFWNNDNPYVADPHHLTAKSFEVYKEIMKDPYFIGAKLLKS